MKRWVLLVGVLMVTACSGSLAERDLKDGETPVVMASSVHLACIAMAVGGDDAEVMMLPAEDANPHSYSPTMSDRERLSKCHLFLVNGLGFEPYDPKQLAMATGARLVDCSSGIDTATLLHGSCDCEHEHRQAHNEEAINPHVWLCVSGVVGQANAVTDALCELNPAKASAYRKNLAAYTERLEAIRLDAFQRLIKLKAYTFVSTHNAFPYFAREYGLEQVGVVQRMPGVDPTIEERENLERLLRDSGAGAIFFESGFDMTGAKQLAREFNIPTGVLDPFEQGTPSADGVEKVLQRNIDTVVATLGE